MKKILFSVLVVFLGLFTSAKEYYVKVDGDDSKTGLDDGNAWAHHPWMAGWTGSTILQPGDIVYLKRGDRWRTNDLVSHFLTVGQSGERGAPIITTAYGKGDRPLIGISGPLDYSVIYISGKSFLEFHNLHIKHYSSEYAENRSGIYMNGSINPCHDILIKDCEISDIPFIAVFGHINCHNIVVGDTLANQIAHKEKYSNHIRDFGYAGVFLMGSNPENRISNFHVYHNYIHDATISHDYQYGISFNARTNSSSWPRYCYAKYNRVENIPGWEGIDAHGGSYLYITDNFVKNFGTAGIIVMSDPRWEGLLPMLDHVFIERNIVEQSHEIDKVGSFISEASSTDLVVPSHIYIRNNQCYYSQQPLEGKYNGIRGGNINYLTISGNTIINGAKSFGRPGIFLSHNYGNYGNENIVISNNFIHEWGPGISFDGGHITGDVLVNNNIVINPIQEACLLVKGDDIPSSGNFALYNNVFISSTSYFRCCHFRNGIQDGARVIAKNNIIGWLEPTNGYYWSIQGMVSGSFISNHNLYWNSIENNEFLISNIEFGWEEWQDMDLDINSLYGVDPGFLNNGGSFNKGLDFIIDSSSKAVDAGVFVGLNQDFIGDQIIGLPDIGAFEAQVYNSIGKELEIKFFPNPIYDFITIRVDEPNLLLSSIRIQDLSGKILFQRQVNPKSKELSFRIDLPTGIYVCQVHFSNTRLMTEKVLVIR